MDYNIREIKHPIEISASKINLFKECPIKYYFRYLTDLDVKQTIWPGNLFGQTLHRILEDTIKQVNDKIDFNSIVIESKGKFQDIFFKLREEAGKDWKKSRAYDEAEYLKKGEKFTNILLKFIIKFLPESSSQLMSECKFKHPWFMNADVVINGITDLIIFNQDNTIDIVDLKVTSNSEQYYFVYWNWNVQSLIYEYLTFKAFERYASTFNFIVVNHDEKTLFLKRKYVEQPQDMEQYFGYLNNIITQMYEFIFAPDLSLKCYGNGCKWCEYKNYCAKI